MNKGTLYIVATPIGNLEDITLRAIRTLKESDFIAAEDTRHTKILLNKYGIEKPLISYYSYNKIRKTDKIVGLLKEGKDIALVSDSGTPGISDPGELLIKEAIKESINIIGIPGPTALIAGLVLSGKPTAKFIFEGFLSNKSGRRQNRLRELKCEKRTVILYESCHRITKLLSDMKEILGERQIAVAREITKKFEEVKRGTPEELFEYFSGTKPRGEFVVIF
ncbi:MAG: 16S rRNA (cytidine(1402)-2'-O)-methyltransferase [Candidatus Omnitrophica bacterium]|nr:16S rRNA (cytidine(1402)-2'-O)-methyltransferase [Candidatus Omnitrophota bacterium]